MANLLALGIALLALTFVFVLIAFLAVVAAYSAQAVGFQKRSVEDSDTTPDDVFTKGSLFVNSLATAAVAGLTFVVAFVSRVTSLAIQNFAIVIGFTGLALFGILVSEYHVFLLQELDSLYSCVLVTPIRTLILPALDLVRIFFSALAPWLNGIPRLIAVFTYRLLFDLFRCTTSNIPNVIVAVANVIASFTTTIIDVFVGRGILFNLLEVRPLVDNVQQLIITLFDPITCICQQLDLLLNVLLSAVGSVNLQDALFFLVNVPLIFVQEILTTFFQLPADKGTFKLERGLDFACQGARSGGLYVDELAQAGYDVVVGGLFLLPGAQPCAVGSFNNIPCSSITNDTVATGCEILTVEVECESLFNCDPGLGTCSGLGCSISNCTLAPPPIFVDAAQIQVPSIGCFIENYYCAIFEFIRVPVVIIENAFPWFGIDNDSSSFGKNGLPFWSGDRFFDRVIQFYRCFCDFFELIGEVLGILERIGKQIRNKAVPPTIQDTQSYKIISGLCCAVTSYFFEFPVEVLRMLWSAVTGTVFTVMNGLAVDTFFVTFFGDGTVENSLVLAPLLTWRTAGRCLDFALSALYEPLDCIAESVANVFISYYVELFNIGVVVSRIVQTIIFPSKFVNVDLTALSCVNPNAVDPADAQCFWEGKSPVTCLALNCSDTRVGAGANFTFNAGGFFAGNGNCDGTTCSSDKPFETLTDLEEPFTRFFDTVQDVGRCLRNITYSITDDINSNDPDFGSCFDTDVSTGGPSILENGPSGIGLPLYRPPEYANTLEIDRTRYHIGCCLGRFVEAAITAITGVLNVERQVIIALVSQDPDFAAKVSFNLSKIIDDITQLSDSSTCVGSILHFWVPPKAACPNVGGSFNGLDFSTRTFKSVWVQVYTSILFLVSQFLYTALKFLLNSAGNVFSAFGAAKQIFDIARGSLDGVGENLFQSISLTIETLKDLVALLTNPLVVVLNAVGALFECLLGGTGNLLLTLSRLIELLRDSINEVFLTLIQLVVELLSCLINGSTTKTPNEPDSSSSISGAPVSQQSACNDFFKSLGENFTSLASFYLQIQVTAAKLLIGALLNNPGIKGLFAIVKAICKGINKLRKPEKQFDCESLPTGKWFNAFSDSNPFEGTDFDVKSYQKRSKVPHALQEYTPNWARQFYGTNRDGHTRYGLYWYFRGAETDEHFMDGKCVDCSPLRQRASLLEGKEAMKRRRDLTTGLALPIQRELHDFYTDIGEHKIPLSTAVVEELSGAQYYSRCNSIMIQYASVLWEDMSGLERTEYMDCVTKLMMSNAVRHATGLTNVTQPDITYNFYSMIAFMRMSVSTVGALMDYTASRNVERMWDDPVYEQKCIANGINTTFYEEAFGEEFANRTKDDYYDKWSGSSQELGELFEKWAREIRSWLEDTVEDVQEAWTGSVDDDETMGPQAPPDTDGDGETPPYHKPTIMEALLDAVRCRNSSDNNGANVAEAVIQLIGNFAQHWVELDVPGAAYTSWNAFSEAVLDWGGIHKRDVTMQNMWTVATYPRNERARGNQDLLSETVLHWYNMFYTGSKQVIDGVGDMWGLPKMPEPPTTVYELMFPREAMLEKHYGLINPNAGLDVEQYLERLQREGFVREQMVQMLMANHAYQQNPYKLVMTGQLATHHITPDSLRALHDNWDVHSSDPVDVLHYNVNVTDGGSPFEWWQSTVKGSTPIWTKKERDQYDTVGKRSTGQPRPWWAPYMRGQERSLNEAFDMMGVPSLDDIRSAQAQLGGRRVWTVNLAGFQGLGTPGVPGGLPGLDPVGFGACNLSDPNTICLDCKLSDRFFTVLDQVLSAGEQFYLTDFQDVVADSVAFHKEVQQEIQIFGDQFNKVPLSIVEARRRNKHWVRMYGADQAPQAVVDPWKPRVSDLTAGSPWEKEWFNTRKYHGREGPHPGHDYRKNWWMRKNSRIRNQVQTRVPKYQHKLPTFWDWLRANREYMCPTCFGLDPATVLPPNERLYPDWPFKERRRKKRQESTQRDLFFDSGTNYFHSGGFLHASRSARDWADEGRDQRERLRSFFEQRAENTVRQAWRRANATDFREKAGGDRVFPNSRAIAPSSPYADEPNLNSVFIDIIERIAQPIDDLFGGVVAFFTNTDPNDDEGFAFMIERFTTCNDYEAVFLCRERRFSFADGVLRALFVGAIGVTIFYFVIFVFPPVQILGALLGLLGLVSVYFTFTFAVYQWGPGCAGLAGYPSCLPDDVFRFTESLLPTCIPWADDLLVNPPLNRTAPDFSCRTCNPRTVQRFRDCQGDLGILDFSDNLFYTLDNLSPSFVEDVAQGTKNNLAGFMGRLSYFRNKASKWLDTQQSGGLEFCNYATFVGNLGVFLVALLLVSVVAVAGVGGLFTFVAALFWLGVNNVIIGTSLASSVASSSMRTRRKRKTD